MTKDTHLSLARRMEGIAPFHVMALLARARALEAQGRSIVHMEIGEPDFPTPRPVCEAAIRLIATGQLFYTQSLGLPALREAISRFYAERYAVHVPPSRIVVTPGASAALLLAVTALVNAGDEVLMADPCYPCNRNFVRMLGGTPVAVPVGAQSAYQLLPEMVERHWSARTKAVMVASPSNPTGTLMPEDSLRRIAAISEERGGALIVDEIYHGLVYDGSCTTALKLNDDVFVINSFSKYFNMTGWRLGWMVVPERFVSDLDKLAQNVYLSAPTAAQHAALAAFEPATLAILEERRAEFKQRRDFLVPALRTLGFRIPVVPQGAFYVYADCSAFTADSFAFARDLLEGAGVAITPGADFGAHGAERHVRFAYTNAVAVLDDGVRRIAQFLGRAIRA
jgi:aspartate/methionine/tyrosine aminotransferase